MADGFWLVIASTKEKPAEVVAGYLARELADAVCRMNQATNDRDVLLWPSASKKTTYQVAFAALEAKGKENGSAT